MNTNYYLTLPITIVINKNLSPLEKILLAHIHSLSKNKNKYCYATNNYLAKFHNVSPRTITKYISLLKTKSYIKIEYIKSELNTTKRKIYIANKKVWNTSSGGIEESSNNGIDKSFYQNKEIYNKKYNNNNYKQDNIPNWMKNPEMCTKEQATDEEIAELEELLKEFKQK